MPRSSVTLIDEMFGEDEAPDEEACYQQRKDRRAFSLERFALPDLVPKNGSTHHSMGPPFIYYIINDALMQKLWGTIYSAHSSCAALSLCEHVDFSKKTRFFVDLDVKQIPDFPIAAFMEFIQTCIRAAVSVNVLNRCSEIHFKDQYKDWNVNPKEWDSLMCCTLYAPYPHEKNKAGFHLIWPHLLLTDRENKLLAQHMKTLFGARHPEWVGFLDFPQTMRMILCDKKEEVMDIFVPAKRPYIPHAMWQGSGKRMITCPEQCTTFPLPYGDKTTRNKQACLKGWFALTSLRWTYYASALAGKDLEKLPLPTLPALPLSTHTHFLNDGLIPAKIDSKASATEWAKFMCQYDPAEMKRRFFSDADRTEETVESLVVNYVNMCVAMVYSTSPVLYAVKIMDPDKRYPSIKFIKENDLKSLFAAPSIFYMVGKTEKKKQKATTVFKVWTTSARKRVISKVVFSPGRKVPDCVLNLWKGYAWDPHECIALKDYVHPNGFSIKEIIEHFLVGTCRGNEEQAKYFIQWLASVNQRPGISTDVVPILGGPEGCGKTIFFSAWGKLFGDAYAQTYNPDDIVGRFNSMIQDKLIIHIDELDGMDSKQSAAFRATVTDHKRKRIERKGQEVFYMEDAPINYVVTTNKPNQNIMKVGPNARRWFMTSCERLPWMDDTYFTRMAKFFEDDDNKGSKALAGFLFTVNLTNFNTRIVPSTSMLMEQKLMGMLKEHSFLFESVFRGYFTGTMLDKDNHKTEARFYLTTQSKCFIDGETVDRGLTLTADDLYQSYLQWCNNTKSRPENLLGLLTQLNHLIPTLSTIFITNDQLSVVFPVISVIKENFSSLYKHLSFGNDLLQTSYNMPTDGIGSLLSSLL